MTSPVSPQDLSKQGTGAVLVRVYEADRTVLRPQRSKGVLHWRIPMAAIVHMSIEAASDRGCRFYRRRTTNLAGMMPPWIEGTSAMRRAHEAEVRAKALTEASSAPAQRALTHVPASRKKKWLSMKLGSVPLVLAGLLGAGYLLSQNGTLGIESPGVAGAHYRNSGIKVSVYYGGGNVQPPFLTPPRCIDFEHMDIHYDNAILPAGCRRRALPFMSGEPAAGRQCRRANSAGVW